MADDNKIMQNLDCWELIITSLESNCKYMCMFSHIQTHRYAHICVHPLIPCTSSVKNRERKIILKDTE